MKGSALLLFILSLASTPTATFAVAPLVIGQALSFVRNDVKSLTTGIVDASNSRSEISNLKNQLIILRRQIVTAEIEAKNLKQALKMDAPKSWFDIMIEGINYITGQRHLIELVEQGGQYRGEGYSFNFATQQKFDDLKKIFEGLKKENDEAKLSVNTTLPPTAYHLNLKLQELKGLYGQKTVLKSIISKKIAAYNSLPASDLSKITLEDSLATQLQRKLTELKTSITEALATQYWNGSRFRVWGLTTTVVYAGNIQSKIDELLAVQKRMNVE